MAKDTVDVKIGEQIVTIEGVYIPFRAGRMYMPNGDPGYPDESAEFEVLKVIYKGVDISDLINEIDTMYYNKVEDKTKFRTIWEYFDENAVEQFEKLLR